MIESFNRVYGLMVLFVHLGRLAFPMNLLEIRIIDCLID